MRLKKVCASLHDMAKPSLMNLHILILILLNGHKIPVPNNNLILKLYPNLSSGSFSDLIKAVLSTKSSNFLYKSGNNKALWDKKSLTTNSKTVTVKIVRVYIAIFHLIKL